MFSLDVDFRIASRNLRRNVRRTLVAVLTVAGGCVAFLLAGGFIAWIFEDMRESTIHSQLGHIQIVRPDYYEKGVADPYAYLLPAQSPEQKVIEQTKGFAGLAPRLAFSGLASHGDVSIAFIGEGIDPERERPLSNRITIVSGENLSDSNEPATLLGEGLAKSLGAKPGDRIVLLVSAENGSPNAIEVKLAGTFATISKEYDDNAVRLPIGLARKLMRVEGSTAWVVQLRQTEQTQRSVEQLRANLPSKGFQIIPWSDLADFYNKTVVLFSKQVSVVKLIIGVIIILTISNTQMMSVLERTSEIGTSLAIGQRRRFILRLFMVEGLLIGLAGGLAGLALGYILASLISAIGIPMPPPPGMARGYIGQILINVPLATESMVLALVTTLLASLLPAWKASRMNIVDALRHNQ